MPHLEDVVPGKHEVLTESQGQAQTRFSGVDALRGHTRSHPEHDG